MNLPQQLEDKKKELINSITCPYCNKVLMLYNGNRLKCLNNKCKGEIKDFPKDVIGDAILEAEIAILEQAIAEMQKQKQEIVDKIKKIVDLYKDSEHPINEIIEAMKDNIYYEFEEQLNQPKTEE